MKTAQIALGASYVDKDKKTARTVTSIISMEEGGKIVHYTEHPANEEERPLYWPLQTVPSMPLREFAQWAALPARTKKPLPRHKFVNWLCGATGRLARTN